MRLMTVLGSVLFAAQVFGANLTSAQIAPVKLLVQNTRVAHQLKTNAPSCDTCEQNFSSCYTACGQNETCAEKCVSTFTTCMSSCQQ